MAETSKPVYHYQVPVYEQKDVESAEASIPHDCNKTATKINGKLQLGCELCACECCIARKCPSKCFHQASVPGDHSKCTDMMCKSLIEFFQPNKILSCIFSGLS